MIDISRIKSNLTSYGMNEFMRLRDDQSLFELLFEDALKHGDPSAFYHKLPGNHTEVIFSKDLTRTQVYKLFQQNKQKIAQKFLPKLKKSFQRLD